MHSPQADKRKIVTIHQPQYFPWLGYFDKLSRADVFVSLGDVQFIKNEYKNRTRVKGAGGVQWLTVPVHYHLGQTFAEVRPADEQPWRKKHIDTLRACYGKTPHFARYETEVSALLSQPWDSLDTLSRATVDFCCKALGIKVPAFCSSDIADKSDDQTQRLVDICKHFGATHYLSGPSGREYLREDTFVAAGIAVIYHDYKHPTYQQRFGDFAPYLSVLDLLCNCGEQSLAVLHNELPEATHIS